MMLTPDLTFSTTEDPNVCVVQIRFPEPTRFPNPRKPKFVQPIGTVRKANNGISSPVTWEPTLGNQPLPMCKNRKTASEALLRAFLKDPTSSPRTPPLIAKCRKIARRKGTLLPPHHKHTVLHQYALPEDVSYQEIQYEDDIIQIVAGVEHGGVEITRKPMPDKGMTDSNPCTMVDEWGRCYRTHSESRHLDEHVEKLLKEIQP